MRLILGGPGTGKTTRLIGIVEETLARGVPPDRIAFVSFTRKAASEAANRAMAKFSLEYRDLPFFRTLHSMAYSRTGVRSNEVIDHADYKIFGELVGVNFTRNGGVSDGPMISGADGDRMQRILSYAHATCIPLETAWRNTGEGVDWYRLLHYSKSYTRFKKDTGKVDFDDMLDNFIDHCEPIDADVVIIDEAQDLSTRHWRVANHAFQNAREVYVAGDDDQSIFKWAGADINHFLSLTEEPEVLPISHRLPVDVFDLAEHISGRIHNRYDKQWEPAGHSGRVVRANRDEPFDFGTGSWMVLARSSCFLNDFRDMVRDAGYAYHTSAGSSVDEDHANAILSWEALRNGKSIEAHRIEHLNGYLGHNRMKKPPQGEHLLNHDALRNDYGLKTRAVWYEALLSIGDARRQYYQSVLRNGETLTAPPRIHIGTIHSVKGGEADSVVLCPDITYRTRLGFDLSPDDEHRVFYTGVTRAKKDLYVLDPVANEYYEIC